MRPIDAALDQLPLEIRDALRRYAKDLDRLLGSALHALILYGSAARDEYLEGRSNVNLLIVLDRHDTSALQRYAGIHPRWSRERIVVPLFVTGPELDRLPHVFPLEYTDMADCHHVIAGQDPFVAAAIDRDQLRQQCRMELRGNLLRLRQRFVEGGGTTEAIAILLPLSLTSLLIALRGVFRALPAPVPRSTDVLLRELNGQLGVESAALQEVWNLKRGLLSPGPAELPRLFDRYLSSLEAIEQTVERSFREGAA